MKRAIDRLIEGIKKTGNPVCAGLDTQLSHIPPQLTTGGHMHSPDEAARTVLEYNKRLIDALVDVVPSVKAQVAYYELLGVPGMAAFRDTLAYARAAGLVAIADAKRNDIGSTAEAYADAYLGEHAPFACDFLTVNPYIGSDGVKPFLTECEKNGGGIFCLVKTSNPSSGELQDMELAGGGPVYAHMGGLAAKWGESLMGECGYSSVGAVVGATYPDEARALREQLPRTFFLIPGYGAQGGTAKDIAVSFDKDGLGGVVNASRSLLTAWKASPGKDFALAVREEALRMRDDLRAAIDGRRE